MAITAMICESDRHAKHKKHAGTSPPDPAWTWTQPPGWTVPPGIKPVPVPAGIGPWDRTAATSPPGVDNNGFTYPPRVVEANGTP